MTERGESHKCLLLSIIVTHDLRTLYTEYFISLELRIMAVEDWPKLESKQILRLQDVAPPQTPKIDAHIKQSEASNSSIKVKSLITTSLLPFREIIVYRPKII